MAKMLPKILFWSLLFGFAGIGFVRALNFDHQENTKGESEDRAKRESQLLTSTDIRSTRFSEVADKIQDVIRKIQPTDDTANRFKEILSGIDESYNAFHSKENEMSDSPIRMSITKYFEPLFVIMEEMKANQCQTSKLPFSNSSIEKSVKEVNKSINTFWEAKKQVDRLPLSDLLAEAELLGINGTLMDMNDQKMPSSAMLKSMSDGVNEFDEENVMCALAGWTTVYVSKMLFALDLHSFMADNSYAQGNMEQYNEFFESIHSTYRIAKNFLVGGGLEGPLITKVLDAVKRVESGNTTLEIERLHIMEGLLERLKTQLESTELPLVLDLPEILPGKPDFGDQPIKTPLGNWKEGANVSYAVLYRHSGMQSRLGKWMYPITIAGEASPTIRLGVHPKRYDRLIFRRFNNQKPLLVGVLNDKYQTEFRDVHRDLYEAAASSDKNSIKDADVLIRNGADIHTVFEGGRSSVHAAAQSDNVVFARKFLIQSNDASRAVSEMNAVDHRGYTPMHVACEAGNRRFVEMLLEAGAEVNSKTHQKQWTPLHIAASKGFVSAMKTLMKSRGLDVNSRDAGGFTPLHYAVGGGIHVLKAMMADNRTDMRVTSDKGISPLILAIIEEYSDVVSTLLHDEKVLLNPNTTGLSAPSAAAIVGNTEIMNNLITFNVVGRNEEGINKWTPLHFALALGKKEIVEHLLSTNGTFINAKSNNRITPLHIAAVTNQKDMVEMLIKHGALIDQETELGLSAIQLALMHNYDDITNVLIINGADIQANKFDGGNILSYAIDNNKYGIIQSLIRRGINMNARSNISGETVLHAAIRTGNLEIIESLLQHGAGVNSKDRNGDTPLHYAVLYLNDRLDILHLLIRSDADVNSTNLLGRSALHVAARNGRLDQVRILVENEIDLNSRDFQGVTPLHVAVEDGARDILNYLISSGADVNVMNSKGESPLHLAVRCNNLDMIGILVSKNASIDLEDNWGRAPLIWALEHKDPSIITYLRANSGKQRATFSDPFHTRRTPDKSLLYAAVAQGNFDIARTLLRDLAVDAAEKMKLLEVAYAAGENNVIPRLFDNNYGHYRQLGDKALACTAAKYNQLSDMNVVGYDWGYISLGNNELLCCAGGNIEIIRYLLKEVGRVDVNYDCMSSSKPIVNAAKAGCVDAVALLAERGAITDFSIDEYSDSALWAAVTNGRANVVNYLVQRGADLNMTNLNGNSLLLILLSVRQGASNLLGMVKSLVENGADINVKSNNGDTPVTLAAKYGRIEVLNYLLERGATVDVTNSEMQTILNSIIQDPSIMTSCVEVGVLANLVKIAGYSPLLYIFERGSTAVVNYLISEGLESNVADREGRTPLHVVKCELDVVKKLVGRGADVNSKTINGTTPLHTSVARCGPDVVDYLVMKGADVNSADYEGQTPLHLVKTCSLPVIETLVEHGGNLSSVTNHGITAMLEIFRQCSENPRIVNYLLGNGAFVHAADPEGLTPLHLIRGCSLDVIKTLVELGADVNSRAKDGTEPLHVAVNQCDDSEAVDYLVSKGANANSADLKGRTPLHFVRACNLGVARILVDNGANVNSVTDEGITPLMHATKSNCARSIYLKSVKYLVSKGALVNISDYKGLTPLHYAVTNGYIDTVKYLVENGAQVNSESASGETPLHVAARRGHMDIIRRLISSGAEVNAKNSIGDTPLFYAAEQANLDTVKYLVEHGAKVTAKNKFNESPINYCPSLGHGDDSTLAVMKYLKEKKTP